MEIIMIELGEKLHELYTTSERCVKSFLFHVTYDCTRWDFILAKASLRRTFPYGVVLIF